jgi:hypothetical protein
MFQGLLRRCRRATARGFEGWIIVSYLVISAGLLVLALALVAGIVGPSWLIEAVLALVVGRELFGSFVELTNS